jgi:hypothetical protein
MVPQENLSAMEYTLMLGKPNVSQIMLCSDRGIKQCDDC